MNLRWRLRGAFLRRRQTATPAFDTPPNIDSVRTPRAPRRAPIPLKSDYAKANYNLGNMLWENDRLDEAEASYRIAIAALPDFTQAHAKLGKVLKAQGKLDKAVASYRRAIALDPENGRMHNSLGNALARLGRVDEALACYRRAIEIDGDNVDAHCDQANHRPFFPGDPEIDRLKEFLARDDTPEDKRTRIRFALGTAHDRIGRYAEAFSYYEAANKEMARRRGFKASRHRKRIAEIKKAFPERCDVDQGDAAVARPLPVFVVGLSRSGKTLVESLLSQHHSVYGAGERREWSLAVEEILERRSILKPYPKYVSLLGREDLREIGSIYLDGITKYSPNSRFIVNTMPGNYRFIGMIFLALPEAKIIFCRRDPMDNCLFSYFYHYARGHEYSYDLNGVGTHYSNCHDLMDHWLGLYGNRILDVRYEDMVRDPAGVGPRIFEFCGLDYDPAVIDWAVKTDEVGHSRHYEPYLGPLRRALEESARKAKTSRWGWPIFGPLIRR
jgi:cytochrome c-type biogenesis protein CcmH/NrfG